MATASSNVRRFPVFSFDAFTKLPPVELSQRK
jgi:hypothetical protein